MKVCFKIKKVDNQWTHDWVVEMNKQLNCNITIKDGNIIFPENIAEGTASFHMLADGLGIFTSNLKYKVPVHLERLPLTDNSYYTLHVNCSCMESEHFVNKKAGKIGGNGGSGLFWASSSTLITHCVKPFEKAEYIVILMSKEYLINSLWDVEMLPTSYKFQNKEHIISDHLYAQMGKSKYELAQEIIHYNKASAIPEKIFIQANVLKILALFIKRITLEQKNDQEKTLQFDDAAEIMKIKNLIEEHVDNRHFTLDELAKIAGMSKTKLKIKFKEITGSSVYQYYIDIRMQRAKEHLYNNPSSITDIAYDMGFKTVSHFSQLFKKHYGISPKSILLSSRRLSNKLT